MKELQNHMVFKSNPIEMITLCLNYLNFKGDCLKADQDIIYCGVGAPHQNAVVESKIKGVLYGTKNILLNALRKWPSVISTVL